MKTKHRLNTQGSRVGRLYGILLMLSYWGCIVVDAQAPFAPADTGELKAAVDACLSETPVGSCPTFANKLNAIGNGDNGAIGDWDVSKVTDMFNSTFATTN